VDTRCPIDPEADAAWNPGDLNKMFENIISDPALEQYAPVILSSPPHGPWIIMLENVLSNEETERLIELGGDLGYERSTDVGDIQADGTYSKSVSSGRTSTNAWCVDGCYEDAVAQRAMQIIESITGIPEANSENLQLLHYEENEFYQTHNDYIPYQVDRQCGPRILTFYMYLNDVEEGGGTNFPKLDLTVTPKRGRAVIWPSVLDHDPNQKDTRTDHQAMKVIKGVKYGANAWVHQQDFKTPNKNGCA
jgi:prolyl 4-hydroxylase